MLSQSRGMRCTLEVSISPHQLWKNLRNCLDDWLEHTPKFQPKTWLQPSGKFVTQLEAESKFLTGKPVVQSVGSVLPRQRLTSCLLSFDHKSNQKHYFNVLVHQVSTEALFFVVVVVLFFKSKEPQTNVNPVSPLWHRQQRKCCSCIF